MGLLRGDLEERSRLGVRDVDWANMDNIELCLQKVQQVELTPSSL